MVNETKKCICPVGYRLSPNGQNCSGIFQTSLELSSFKIMLVLCYFILRSKSFSFNLKTILYWFSHCRKVETAYVLYNIKTSALKKRKKRNDWENYKPIMKCEEILSRADHASGHIRAQCVIGFVTSISWSLSRLRFSYALSCIMNLKVVAKININTTIICDWGKFSAKIT